jgi:cytochrome c oxidase subunit 4
MARDISNHYEAEPHDTTKPTPHHHVPYMLIFVLLSCLTVITVLVAMKRFESEAVNVLLALLVASIKASLVCLFFMHMKFEGKLIYAIFLVPLALCVLLVVALLPDLLPLGENSLMPFNAEPMMSQTHEVHAEAVPDAHEAAPAAAH